MQAKKPVNTTKADSSVETDLVSIYEEIMWLAARPDVNPSRARAWYTHVMAESVKKRIRRFTGYVSVEAVRDATGPLRLEHYKRIQTSLTALVDRHRSSGKCDSAEFVRVVLECEQVHIVTLAENYAAMQAKGDYAAARIELVHWSSVAVSRQQQLWKQMLRGKVANAFEYSG